ncbi:hypothetical protein [Novosphingobium sp. M1R2S20]|uniref:TRAP-type C4-dicarboxylate transport system permease small subunit n=1 Tax=Novosphingobium rhizovicinum TaxID=3228928 RepID=A0ABV3RCM0_9SPHN
MTRQVRGKTGIWTLLNWWLALDLAVASVATAFLKVDGFLFAEKGLFPATAILVSMSVAWTARAATVINDNDFRKAIISEDRPLVDYVYGYQLCLLVIMSTVVYIAIMAVGGFDFYMFTPEISRAASTVALYFLLSLSVRLCWTVINFSNLLALLKDRL